MYSHTTVGSNNLARAKSFYDGVFAPLDLGLWFSTEDMLAYKPTAGRPLFLVVRPFNGGEAVSGNGAMVAFLAPNRAVVTACHAAAIAGGGTDEGSPGLRPQYHENYYGAYFRDPDGNKICVCCHHPE
ncbi:VOC family protein [Microvirga sp. 2MCAF38]|uniref:VOC family protein n=1 Tax=Microvirga sp. 2MCAF38 TaxID=3232989 RepID=UPI003F996487